MKTIHSSLSFATFVILILLSNGCVRHYQNIPFAWTSENRIPPHERILTLNQSPENVLSALQDWAASNSGLIISSITDHGYKYELRQQCNEKFEELKKFEDRYWRSFDQDKNIGWGKSEWNKLAELMSGQIDKLVTREKSYALEVRVGERTGSFDYQEQVGANSTMIMVPIYNAYSKYTMMIPQYVSTPVYETRTKTECFSSLISFFIYQHNGKTNVYGYGVPEFCTGRYADWNQTIEHHWWPQVTGKEEANLIKDAFKYLSERGK